MPYLVDVNDDGDTEVCRSRDEPLYMTCLSFETIEQVRLELKSYGFETEHIEEVVQKLEISNEWITV